MAMHALTVEPDLQIRLEALAAGKTCSPELLVRHALEAYLALAEEQARLSKQFASPADEERKFAAEAQASWEHYQRTGLHVTHEEVLAWFDRLEDDPHAPLPECHT